VLELGGGPGWLSGRCITGPEQQVIEPNVTTGRSDCYAVPIRASLLLLARSLAAAAHLPLPRPTYVSSSCRDVCARDTGRPSHLAGRLALPAARSLTSPAAAIDLLPGRVPGAETRAECARSISSPARGCRVGRVKRRARERTMGRTQEETAAGSPVRGTFRERRTSVVSARRGTPARSSRLAIAN